MRADGGADAVDDHPAVQPGKASFHQVGDGTGIVIAGGHRDVALAVIIQAAPGIALHHLHDLADDLFLGADLVSGNQPAEVIHVHQGADFQKAAENGSGFRNAPAADEEREVR